MAIIWPAVGITIVVIGVVVVITNLAGTDVGNVENVCGSLMMAVVKKDRHAIETYAGISDPRAGEMLAQFAMAHDVTQYKLMSSTTHSDTSTVRVHIVFNRVRDEMLGKTTDRQNTHIKFHFRWSSGRWIFAGHEIE